MTPVYSWSIEELIQIIESARAQTPQRPPGVITTPEYAQQAGIAIRTAQARLVELKNQGLAESGVEVTKENIHGMATRVKGWRLDLEKIVEQWPKPNIENHD